MTIATDNFVPAFILYKPPHFPKHEMLARSRSFYHFMDERRSVRDFSDQPVPQELMEYLIRTASTAPSGAHKQPWTFCLVGNPELKRQIREAAEAEEQESYERRMSQEWLDAIEPLGTDWEKPFLETAPWLIVCFKKNIDVLPDGERKKNYYVTESVGIACGMLIAAIHNAGLVTVTHTPNPMDFLSRILDRPDNEKPYMLVPVGYAAEGAMVPNLQRKHLDEVMVVY